jgi:hypothetical protein
VNELVPTGTVTLVLADVEASTRLWESQPEEMAAAVAHLDRTVCEIVAACGGGPAVWTVAHRGYSGNRRLDVWIYRDENTALRAAAELARSCGVDEDTLHSPNMFRASRVRVLPPMMHLIDQLGQRNLLE